MRSLSKFAENIDSFLRAHAGPSRRIRIVSVPEAVEDPNRFLHRPILLARSAVYAGFDTGVGASSRLEITLSISP